MRRAETSRPPVESLMVLAAHCGDSGRHGAGVAAAAAAASSSRVGVRRAGQAGELLVQRHAVLGVAANTPAYERSGRTVSGNLGHSLRTAHCSGGLGNVRVR